MRFSPIVAFDIDDGELAGESREQAFCLGVEYGMAFAAASYPARFVLEVHATNADRIEAMLRSRERKFRVARAAGWATFVVAGLD